MKVRVYYEDTDCGGIVYHSKYLNFCERARSEMFFQKGLSPHDENEFFVVRKMDCDFIKSAKFGDVLDINTEVLEIKKASLTIKQTIFRDDEYLFSAIVLLVFLKNQKPSKIPQSCLEIFA
ncbi:YbgC/FadM family acyl-CoA thioesterase [Arcobacter sp. FWKO B]|uniref:YbgC/FadM family acyl-CoA thioesterase n=1 Tax=Arcobacter sp. FWKO B TaxID=2593672 RepID=UPI0018A620ED|nr:YbgC/FadM family acyl-CoA thioesterase [Arcobacter sp. FWKO B]QOG12941.1 YbgC/FadM family acyl-CoA thioesterase [Arcobacter sp. FWKO B]